MRSKKANLILGGLGILLLVLVGGFALLSSNDGLTGKPITIAVAVDDPGYQGSRSTVLRGAQLLVDQINEAGGLKGRPVQLSLHDDDGDPEKAKEIAAKIADSDAVAVVGHRISTTSIAAGPVYQERKIPAITPTATSPSVTKGNPYYFAAIYDNDFLGRFLAEYVRVVVKPEQTFVVTGDHQFGKQLATEFEKTATESGLAVEPPLLLSADLPDSKEKIEEIVQKVKAVGGPVAMLLAGYPTREDRTISLVRALRDARLPVTLIGPDSFDTPDFPKKFAWFPAETRQPGFYVDGFEVATPLVYDTAGREASLFRERYTQKYKSSPDWRAPFARDAVAAVIQALETSETALDPATDTATVREEVRKALDAMNSVATGVDGVTGPTFFNYQGSADKPAGIARFEGNVLVSALTQFKTVRNLPGGADLDAMSAQGDVVEVGGQVMHRTAVVFTGVLLDDISDINPGTMTAKLSGEVWFRYKAADTEDLDPANIVFENATAPIALKPEGETVREGGTQYERYRFDGTFRLDFEADRRVFHEPLVGVSFRHQSRPTNEIIYVTDLRGMGMAEGDTYANTLAGLTPVLEAQGWTLRDAAAYQSVQWVLSRGVPAYVNQPDGMMPFSNFVASLRLSKPSLAHDLGANHNTFLYALGGGVVLLIATIVAGALWPRRARILPVLVLQMVVALVILWGGSELLFSMVSERLPFAVLDIFDMVLGALWWLIPAFFASRAVHRFVWRPLEIRSGRQVPNLMRFLVDLIIMVVALGGIIAFVLHLPLTSLLATSGLLTLIIGMAIQGNIANVFSGIILNIDRPMRVGDWVKIGGGEVCQVTDVSWRSVKLRTRFNVAISIPNSHVTETVLENYSRDRAGTWIFVPIIVDRKHSPETVTTLITEALLERELQPGGWTPQHAYSASLIDANDKGLVYSMGWQTPDYQAHGGEKVALFKVLWRKFHEAGIAFAVPHRDVGFSDDEEGVVLGNRGSRDGEEGDV